MTAKAIKMTLYWFLLIYYQSIQMQNIGLQASSFRALPVVSQQQSGENSVIIHTFTHVPNDPKAYQLSYQ